jgi:hypothetical protein
VDLKFFVVMVCVDTTALLFYPVLLLPPLSALMDNVNVLLQIVPPPLLVELGQKLEAPSSALEQVGCSV